MISIKKQAHRTLSVILSILLLLLSMQFAPVYADDTQTLTLKLTDAVWDDEYSQYVVGVTATSSDGNSFNMYSGELYVTYDSNVLSFAEAAIGDIPEVKVGRTTYTLGFSSADTAAADADGYTVLTYSSSSGNNFPVESGATIATLYFNVVNGVESCETVLTMNAPSGRQNIIGYYDSGQGKDQNYVLSDQTSITIAVKGELPTIGTVTVDPAEVTVDGTTDQTANVTVKSAKGTAMAASDVSWAVTYNNAETSDVTVGTDGKVTVKAQAKAGTYTLTANEVADKSKGSANATLTVKHADSVLKTLEPASSAVTVDGTKAEPASIALTAKDQFGETMSGVTYEVSPADQGVTVSGSSVSVTQLAKSGSYTLTARAGNSSATAKITVTRAGAKAQTIVVSGGDPEITVPVSGSNSSKAFSPTVTDQYGDPMTNPNITWSVADARGNAVAGVTIANGVVTVAPAAKEAVKDTAGKQLVVTAASGDAKGTANITVKRETPAAASVTIQKDGTDVADTDTITKPVAGAPDKTVTYTAKVLDQYGDEMKDAAVTWSNDVTVAGITVTNNAVTVTSEAKKGAAGTLTAKASDTVSASVTLNISDLEVDWSAVSAKDVEYGTANKDAVTVPASGTASDGTNTINGTFTVQNADAIPAVGPATVTVEFTVTDAGDYKDLKVTKDYTFNVTPKALTVTGGDFAAVKDYDGTTEVKNPSGVPALEGVVGQDEVSVNIGTIGEYNDANAGQDKKIVLSGLTLTGAAAGNYTLSADSFTVENAVINKIEPTQDLLKVEGVPADLPYEGKEHPATVTAAEGVQGLGEITVKYNGDTAAPAEADTYQVTAEVAEGTNYKAKTFELGSITITKTRIDTEVKTNTENRTGDSSVDEALEGETKVDEDNLLENEELKEDLEQQAREIEVNNQDKIQEALQDPDYKLDVELNVNLTINEYSAESDNAYVQMSITLSMTVMAKSESGSVILEENKPVESTEINQAISVQLQLPQGFPTEDLYVDIAQSASVKTLRPTITKISSSASASLMDEENPEGTESTDTYVATWEQSEFGENVTTLYQDSSKIAVTFKYDNGDTETIFYSENDSDETELTQKDETKEGAEFQNWKAEDSGTAVTTVGDIRELLTEGQKEITLVSVFKTPSTGGGGGGAPSTYAVTAPTDTANGTVTTNVAKAKQGDTVTITPAPEEGYKTGAVTVKDKDGKDVEVTDNGDGTYSFTMPASPVTIDASFVEDAGEEPNPPEPSDHENCPSEPYTDVDTSLWYHEGIDYVIENGIMNGISENQFAPDMTTTRAMIVTILHRLDGAQEVDTASTFKDVEANSWYEAAVNWAAANDIVKGYDEDTFGPNDVITREQMAAILFRYAKYNGMENLRFADLSGFTDSAQVSEYAGDAMAWAVEEGLIKGMTDTTLEPQGSATRAQAATLIMRLCENVLK